MEINEAIEGVIYLGYLGKLRAPNSGGLSPREMCHGRWLLACNNILSKPAIAFTLERRRTMLYFFMCNLGSIRAWSILTTRIDEVNFL